MAVMSLLIDRRGTQLSLHSTGVVEVRQDDGETHRVGLSGLRRIIVQGDAQISASLLRACREHGVAVVLAAGRGRGETTHLFPEHRAAITLRPEDFSHGAQEGCRLGKEGRATYFREWHTSEEQWLPRPGHRAQPAAPLDSRYRSRVRPLTPKAHKPTALAPRRWAC